MTTVTSSSHGAYGFRLEGLPGARELLVPAPGAWPALHIVRRVGEPAAPVHERVNDRSADLRLASGGAIRLDRASGRAEYLLPRALGDAELVHPFLAPAALVAARWLGRESFHAGALVADGGAWALLGEKGTGKSSTLAWLAAHGHPILTDDVLVVDGAAALAGPRCLDLRKEAAARLGVGEDLGVVGLRRRWRLALPAVAPAVPLRGWVSLAWGEEVTVTAVRGRERVLALLPHRGLRLDPADPAALLALISLPHWELRRPRRWDSLPEAAERLLAALSR